MAMPFNPSRLEDVVPESAYRTAERGKELVKERERLVAWLKKARRKDQTGCNALAERLEQCRPYARCRSAACPECTKAAQRHFAKALKRFLEHASNFPGEIVCVSVIPADGVTRPRDLHSLVPALAIRRWREKLAKTEIPFFVGGIDVSFNEHKEGRYKRHWSVHVWGFTTTTDLEQLKADLKALFPKTDEILRPVNVKVWDGRARALRYVLKTDFRRRIGVENRASTSPDGTSRTSRGTVYDRLRSRHREQLLLYLDKYGLQSRLLLRSVQLSGSKSGDVKLLLRSAKPGARRR